MGKVMFGLSVSLDGFIADKNDDVSQVFAWFGNAWEHFNEVVGDALNFFTLILVTTQSSPSCHTCHSEPPPLKLCPPIYHISYH